MKLNEKFRLLSKCCNFWIAMATIVACDLEIEIATLKRIDSIANSTRCRICEMSKAEKNGVNDTLKFLVKQARITAEAIREESDAA